ncbi:MAG: hypothetical protein P8179_25005 [Candidatus Thiodiazotropha sp.]
MLNQNYIVLKIVVLVGMSFLFYGCGGGGGSGDNSAPMSDNINGGLAGRIFTTNGWIIDVATGRSTRSPGIVWDSYCLDFDIVGNDFYCTDPVMDYGRSPAFYTFPNISGDKYIVAVSNCVDGYTLDCIEIHDTTKGELIGERHELYKSVDVARLSRDGEYYAFTFNDDAYYNSPTLIVLNDINNEEITYSTMPDDGPVAFDWTNDNRIVYAYNGAIYITSPYSTEGSKIFDVRDHPEFSNIAGIGGSVRVSPDSTKIAFMLFEEHASTGDVPIPQTPWIINIDGSDLHRFAYAPVSSNGYELFGSLAWSPDGKYILITEGYSAGPLGTDGSTPGFLYAIPSNSRNIELNQDGYNNIIMLKTNYRNDSQELRYTFNGGGLWWTP